MEDLDLKALIEEMWPRIKKKHLYPEIPIPELEEIKDPTEGEDEQSEGVGLEMKQKQMTINPIFVKHLKERMSEKRAVEALLDHGITHYTFCPWDFQTHVMLYAEAKKVVSSKELSKLVASYFIDVVVDTYCVKNRSTEIPELRRHLKRKGVDEVIASLYQKIWGVDLGVPDLGKGAKGKEG